MEPKIKIKLVTFSPHPNYGTCLQSYALNTKLRQMGYDVVFIYNGHESKDIKWSFISTLKKTIKFLLPRKYLMYIHKKRNSHIIDKKLETSIPRLDILEIPNNIAHYIFSKMPFYSKIYKRWTCPLLQQRKVYSFAYEDNNYKMKRLFIKKQYSEIAKNTDIFLTGSDQIWNPYCGGLNPMMFLEFVDGVKKVSYASSISLSEIPPLLENRIRNDLNKFSYISVREQSTVDLLKRVLNRQDIYQVVDPTFLLSNDEWELFASKAKIEFSLPEKYIFCYFIGTKRLHEYIEVVNEVKKHTGIERVITVNCSTNGINIGGDIFYEDGGPYEFIYLLTHASYICLDSFHGTVFSLLFSKDFVHVLKYDNTDNKDSQNSRIIDMFAKYGISFKIYKGKCCEEWKKQIDYSSVHERIRNDVQLSLKYLEKALA